MKNKIYRAYFFILLTSLFATAHAQDIKVDTATKVPRYDTTMKVDRTGYRIICGNKSDEMNEVDVTPLGFKAAARPVTFYVRGKVRKALMDDLNSDGFPDLVLFVFNGNNGEFGSVMAIASVNNESLAPVTMPDIYVDPKLRDGYKGHDEFTMMEGTVLRKFPIYKTGDADNNPTGGKRAVQYGLETNPDNGRMAFKVLRSYDTQ